MVPTIGVLAGAAADGPGVGDGDAKGAGADGAGVGDVAAGGGPVGEVGVRARDFRGFLPKSESIS